jgi:hypothetical protein
MNRRAVGLAVRTAVRHPRLARRLGGAALRHPRRTAGAVRMVRRGSAATALVRRAAADPELRTHVGRMAVAATSAARRAREVGVLALAEDERVAEDLGRAKDELSEALASPGAKPLKARRRRKRLAALAGLAAGTLGAYAAVRSSRSSRESVAVREHHREEPAGAAAR